MYTLIGMFSKCLLNVLNLAQTLQHIHIDIILGHVATIWNTLCRTPPLFRPVSGSLCMPQHIWIVPYVFSLKFELTLKHFQCLSRVPAPNDTILGSVVKKLALSQSQFCCRLRFWFWDRMGRMGVCEHLPLVVIHAGSEHVGVEPWLLTLVIVVAGVCFLCCFCELVLLY